MTLETIKASYDTFATEADPTSTHGPDAFLRVRTDTGQSRYAYIYFPVDTRKLADATISSATLRLHFRGVNSSASFTAKRITQAWKEWSLKWGNKPTVTATNAATASGSSDGTGNDYIDLDVTNIVRDWVTGKAPYGFRVETAATAAKLFHSSEAARHLRPTLFVEWSFAPYAPADLRPSGDQAVDPANPLLVWESETPSEVQVQVDNTPFDFATPVYDSGWVASTDTQHQPSSANLTDNTAYRWRVRIKDGEGLTSEWSEPADFQRRTHGTLVILAPTSTVEETTPTISHQFTGRTQASVAYILEADGEVLWERERTATTETDFQLPAGYVTAEDVQYLIRVRVWDDYARGGSQGTAYVEETQAFEFTRTAGVSAPTGFTAETEDGHVLLSWSRTATPDYWAIIEDGVIVEDRVDPSETSVGGTAHEYAFRRAAPHLEHVYEVQAVVMTSGVHKHSTSNPTATVTFAPRGIWLLDEEDGTEVRIIGRDAARSELGETGVTLYPVGRQAPVRLVDHVRGLEGTVSGVLRGTGTRTAAEEREALLAMKTYPTRTRRLILGRRNIPVVLGTFAVADDPSPEEGYAVAVEYWQVGEFEVVNL